MISEAFVIFCYILGWCSAESGYLITTPFTWTSGVDSQICVSLINGEFSSEDALRFSLFETYKKYVVQNETEITFTTGLSLECKNVTVPESERNQVTLQLEGQLNSEVIKERVNLSFVDQGERVFISTDKYKYLPGQKVQFRILTLRGPNIEVVTEKYNEIYVENPSRTRIAQWNNVDNSEGLVHLSFDLYNEIDEGFYTIHVDRNVKTFEVREYVLPRFEITLKSPETILGSDLTITLQLCAYYVFGEAVKGNATIFASVGNYQRIYANISQTKEIEGCQNFTFDTKDLYFDNNNCHIRISRVQGNAIVAEEGTGVEILADTTYFTVHREGIIFYDKTTNDYKRPYLPALIEIEVKYVSGAPAINEPMEACTYFSGENICKNFTTNSEGVLYIVIPSGLRNSVQIRAVNFPRIERNFNDVMRESSYSLYLSYQEYFDPTNTSITVMKNEVECTTGEDIEFKIPVMYATNQEFTADVHLQIQSRGQVIVFKNMSIEFSGSDLDIKEEDKLIPLQTAPEGVILGSFEIPVTLTESASPEIEILVWFVKEDGTVVADSSTVVVSECLPHKVNFSWSEQRVEPGEEAILRIEGAENSLCSIGVVDKSVDILSDGNNNNLDISSILSVVRNSFTYAYRKQTNLQYCLNKYRSNETKDNASVSTPSSGKSSSDTSFYYRHFIQALHIFNEAGFAVISNLFLEKQFCEKLIYQDMKADYGPNYYEYGGSPDGLLGGGSGGVLPSGGGSLGGLLSKGGGEIESQTEDSIQERSYLPETWLWLLRTLSDTGELNEAMTLPDTITEWVGSAVCVHPEEGVGISQRSSIITFTSFFLDLTLPASAVRGEVLPIIISIFNYLDEDLPVKLVIETNGYYEFAEGESGERAVCVSAGSKGTETVKVNVTELGQINVTVQATTEPSLSDSCGSNSSTSKSDRLIKRLLVEPEGLLRERVFTEYVCTSDIENKSSPVAIWSISAPEVAVEDSGRAWITAVGDLLGPTIENLGNLVRMPYGCGEQNMITFAPNIYILQYLELTDQNTPELEAKLKEFLSQGYQRQLRFRRDDGSYSTFGKKDKEGSTWLTAFVVKSFAQAVPYTFIEEKSLQMSIEWLLRLQEPDGCFKARGIVVNKMLQGGFSGSEGSKGLLTAYVLGALLESGRLENSVTQMALQCIATDNSIHPYSLALKSYSLALANASNTKSVIDQLLDLSVSDSNMLRWNLPDRSGQSTPLHVETAAYALLAILTYDYEQYQEEARKIVRWLSSQMNGQGGFGTTQDTVVALQAFAAFEEKEPTDDMNMKVTVSADDFETVFEITEINKLLQQREDLPSLPAEIAIHVNGTGCSLIQGVLRYNVLAESISEVFSLDVTITPKSEPQCDNSTKNIEICTSYQLPDERSNMAIIEIKLVTGYVANEDDLKDIVGEGKGVFKNYEIEGKVVTLYLEEITANETCLNFKAEQIYPIDSAKPGYVSVYDYYQPEYIVTRTLDLNDVSCGE